MVYYYKDCESIIFHLIILKLLTRSIPFNLNIKSHHLYGPILLSP